MLGAVRQLLTRIRGALRRIAHERSFGAVRAAVVDCRTELHQSKRGFALLVVMVVLLALSLMFGAILQITQQYTNEADGRVARLKMTAALDGALLSVAYELSQAAQKVQLGIPTTVQIGEYSVTIVVRPELSKLDVNYASIESLTKLIEASGVSSDRAIKLAASIVAWRGSDNSDVAKLVAAGGTAPARPFETVSDLSLVQNGGPDLAVCLEPDVTVFTRSTGTDASYASERLQRVIYGNAQQPDRPSSYDSVVGGDAARPDLYEITETARDAERHIVLRRQVVVRITGDGRRPVWILAQTSPGSSLQSASAACRRLANHAQ